MTLAALKTMKSRVVERALPASGGADNAEISVRNAASDDRIVIRWPCGDTRSFTAAHLQTTVDDLEHTAAFPEVWLETVDSSGRAFFARVGDGELYANIHATDGSHVNWADLKRALRKMAP